MSNKIAIYLDTSILWPVSITLSDPWFSFLISVTDSFKFPIFIPEIAYLEWIGKKREDINDNITKITNCISYLIKKYEFKALSMDSLSGEGIYGGAISILDDLLKRNNISIVGASDINLNKVISMAIRKIRPFEKKREKGFRDSLILFTCLKHAIKNDFECHLIASDQIYGHEDVIRIAREEGAEYMWHNSINSFIEYLEERITKINQSEKEAKLRLLENYLNTNKAIIERYIQENGKFSISMLNQHLKPKYFDALLMRGLLTYPEPSSEKPGLPNIEKITKIELIGIKVPSLPIKKDVDIVQLYFSAKLKIYVTVEIKYLSFLEYGRKISLKGTEYDSFESSYDKQIYDDIIETEATVYSELKEKDGEYKDLNLRQVGGILFPLGILK